MEELTRLLESGAAALGVPLPEGATARFSAYARRLSERNQVMNLTAITEPEDVVRLHFLDSLALLSFADFAAARVLDVGSGAGFPGLPLLLASPGIDLTLLDAQEKRVRFLEETAAELGVSPRCLHARAEEAGRTELREGFDIVTSRAVARLNLLCELCLPFVKAGGVFLAMKSTGADEETAEAEKAIRLLGGKLQGVRDYEIPGTDVTHRVVIIEKVAPTPPKYPRAFAKIKKSPL